MDQTLFYAICAAGVAYLMFRPRKGRPRRSFFRRGPPTNDPTNARGTMPRIGVPHTVTIAQLDQLEQFSFPRERSWSREEADLIIDTVVYLRGVCAEEIDDPEPELRVQNELLHTILGDQDLRDYVRAWGEKRREEGQQGTDPRPMSRNNQYDRVARAIHQMTTP
jgi:hypothetical protein